MYARRARQVLEAERIALTTPGCGPGYSLRKWRAVLGDARRMHHLGTEFWFEDRATPFHLPEYLHETGAVLRHCPSPGRPLRVLDVGANIGAWARAVLHHRPDAEIVSFEPNPTPFALLERNRVPFPAWTAHNLGVADTEGAITLYAVPGKSGQGSVHRENATQELVFGGEAQPVEVRMGPVTPGLLPSGWGAQPVVDLVKVDVEGAELSAVRGLTGITWRCMYVELSTGRRGAMTPAEFLAEVRGNWPDARLAETRELGVVAELVLVTGG